MAHEYTFAKKIASKTIVILAVITIVEVMLTLTGKGYIIKGFHLPHILISFLMIAGSLWKAYLIVFEFMHMKYEARGLMLSVMLPVGILIWAIIAFLYEGYAWKGNRETVKAREKMEVSQ
ncbi:MAG: cytochrome C oxidase subunit IV family protein [Bacteroidota bacterium]|nr:cytochrome C oxidase subunit IV family protein [Bacteroidota bacterium]